MFRGTCGTSVQVVGFIRPVGVELQQKLKQPLGVGLGLAVRINNQYSHPVCTGRCTDDYMTINDTQEISQEYWLLTWEC